MTCTVGRWAGQCLLHSLLSFSSTTFGVSSCDFVMFLYPSIQELVYCFFLLAWLCALLRSCPLIFLCGFQPCQLLPQLRGWHLEACRMRILALSAFPFKRVSSPQKANTLPASWGSFGEDGMCPAFSSGVFLQTPIQSIRATQRASGRDSGTI